MVLFEELPTTELEQGVFDLFELDENKDADEALNAAVEICEAKLEL